VVEGLAEYSAGLLACAHERRDIREGEVVEFDLRSGVVWSRGLSSA
jgi:hypothetical protein